MQCQSMNDSGFPVELAAEMLAGFRTTPRGCTHPRVGEIDGHRFIAKCGSWSAYSSDEHVHFDAIPERWVKAVKTWEKVDALIELFLDAVER